MKAAKLKKRQVQSEHLGMSAFCASRWLGGWGLRACVRALRRGVRLSRRGGQRRIRSRSLSQMQKIRRAPPLPFFFWRPNFDVFLNIFGGWGGRGAAMREVDMMNQRELIGR